jgi:hypothetical protein
MKLSQISQVNKTPDALRQDLKFSRKKKSKLQKYLELLEN